jgi:hypothetical protein
MPPLYIENSDFHEPTVKTELSAVGITVVESPAAAVAIYQ